MIDDQIDRECGELMVMMPRVMVEIKIDDDVHDVDIDGDQHDYLLGGQKGEEEVRLLQVGFLEKSHKELLERFLFGLENIKAFASKELCPGF